MFMYAYVCLCRFRTCGYLGQAAFSLKDFLFICVQRSPVSSFEIRNSVVLTQYIRICFQSIGFALK